MKTVIIYPRIYACGMSEMAPLSQSFSCELGGWGDARPWERGCQRQWTKLDFWFLTRWKVSPDCSFRKHVRGERRNAQDSGDFQLKINNYLNMNISQKLFETGEDWVYQPCSVWKGPVTTRRWLNNWLKEIPIMLANFTAVVYQERNTHWTRWPDYL